MNYPKLLLEYTFYRCQKDSCFYSKIDLSSNESLSPCGQTKDVHSGQKKLLSSSSSSSSSLYFCLRHDYSLQKRSWFLVVSTFISRLFFDVQFLQSVEFKLRAKTKHLKTNHQSWIKTRPARRSSLSVYFPYKRGRMTAKNVIVVLGFKMFWLFAILFYRYVSCPPCPVSYN